MGMLPAVALLCIGLLAAGCDLPLDSALRFDAPAPNQLSLAGDVAASLRVPAGALSATLQVQLDGADVTGAFSGAEGTRSARIPNVGPGLHTLTAEVGIGLPFGLSVTLRTTRGFEAIALAHGDECEILNDVECLLPYPSSRFLVPAATPTGYRVSLPASGMPTLHPPLSPAPFNALDGFAPTTQILMHFPGGVSLEKSKVSRLLPAGCCGQPTGPPWIDTRVADGRSLDGDSPTVLVDADTGERVLHFVELDVRAAATPERQALILRPLRSLLPGHRYLVAVRRLVHEDGSPVAAEAPFAALRDRRPTDIPQLVARRAAMERVLERLARLGVARKELVLAFDFVTQSDHQLTHQMLSMRDQAFAWLEGVTADPARKPFQVTNVKDVSACAGPNDVVWREVAGTFQSPLFLEGPPIQDASAPALPLKVDANDDPVQNGFMDAPFTISIPCASLDPTQETHPIVLGHGAFGTGDGMVRSIPGSVADISARFGLGEWRYLAGATDWQSICCAPGGLLWIGLQVIGFGQSQLDHFEALPDRTKQGELNTLVLARLMKRGIFNRDPAFQVPDGAGTRGVFPGERNPDNEAFYFGISLGGIYGLFFSALTPDIERFHVDVPAINFSQLLQRSTLFVSPLVGGISFESIVRSLGLTDPLQTLVGYDLLNEIWVSGEPGGYATHITANPLPGSGVGPGGRRGKRILLTMAWLDKTVPNLSTEVAARTLGLPQLDGSLLRGMPQIEDLAGGEGLDSAYVVYDTGSFDLFDPVSQASIPPLANAAAADGRCDPHGMRFSIPAGVAQLLDFLRPGGRVRNFCTDDGLCDASEPFEIPNGAAQPCHL
jgi:hypothetical protein